METTPESPNDPRPRFVTVAVASSRLHLAELTVRRMIDRGTIPATRVGARVLIPEDWFDALLEEARASLVVPVAETSRT